MQKSMKRSPDQSGSSVKHLQRSLYQDENILKLNKIKSTTESVDNSAEESMSQEKYFK